MEGKVWCSRERQAFLTKGSSHAVAVDIQDLGNKYTVCVAV